MDFIEKNVKLLDVVPHCVVVMYEPFILHLVYPLNLIYDQLCITLYLKILDPSFLCGLHAK